MSSTIDIKKTDNTQHKRYVSVGGGALVGVASIDDALVRLLLLSVSLVSAECRGGVAAGCLGEEKCLKTRLFSFG